MKAITGVMMGVGLLVSLAGCDPAYPLFLRNGLATPITVLITFGGDDPLGGGIPQLGERLGFAFPKGDLERVVVLSEGWRLHDLNKRAILDMLSSVPDPRRVTWNIQADRIKPLSRAEVEELQAPDSN